MARARSLNLAGRRVAAALDAAAPAAPAAQLDARVEALRQLRRQRAARAQRVRRASAVVVVLAACLAATLFVFTRPRDLTFTIDGRGGELGAWVAAPSDAPARFAFSDGSTLELHPSGRARVADVSDNGARVLLEDGTLSARVRHLERTSWTIAAGPFEIHVIGTTFDAAWSTADEALTITMVEGKVEVTGACLDGPRPIQGTEALRLSCRGVAAPIAPSASAPASTAESAAASAQPPLPSASVESPSASSPALASPSWRALAKQGAYSDAFALAEREGAFERAAAGPVSEALELAEVARLAAKADVARRLYLSIRARDPGGDAAALAAFQLGRMSFGAGGAAAESWFSTYLAERPNGPLAASALGRILELQYKGGQGHVKDTARLYLERFPSGAHAALARSILES